MSEVGNFISKLGIIEDQLWNLSLPLLENGDDNILFVDSIKPIKEGYEDVMLDIKSIDTVKGDNQLYLNLQKKLETLTCDSTCLEAIRLAILISLLSCMLNGQSKWSLTATRLHNSFHERIDISQIGLASTSEKPDKIFNDLLVA